MQGSWLVAERRTEEQKWPGRTIFQDTVIAKLSYASPAWWGFTSAADKDRLEAFCVGLLSLATVQPLHSPLPTSVPPQMIDYSIALPETPDTYFTLSYLPAVMNITTSDVAPTTTYSYS